MTTPEFFETQVRDDVEHWEALAERVGGAVTRSRQSGFSWLSTSRAGWVAPSLLTGTVLALLILVSRIAQADVRAPWAAVLAPSDNLGRAIVTRADPPAIGALLLTGAREPAR